MKNFIDSLKSKLLTSESLSKLKDPEYIAYNASRQISSKKYICHAPFNNMYFNTEGHIAVCWLTFKNPVIYSEAKTLNEIWNDVKLKSLREHIKQNNLEAQCGTCHKHIKEGNHVNVLSRAYDNDYPLGDYPSIMEFELDNTCNLACTMCNGMLSSTIRKDREKLPPLQSPYGDKFIDELKEFIPQLKEARFNGGEPFLIKKYFKIWDLILAINPEVKITIATNGTVLNPRVKDYLSRGNFHLNISMDGFSKETYESIRINGNHEKLHRNFEWFRDYCHEHNRTLCIMINPMRQNWWEMPDFVNWCNQNKVHLWFNSIMHPEDQSLWNLPKAELETIYKQLSNAEIKENKDTPKALYDYNLKTYNNLVHQQIKTWWKDADDQEKRTTVPKQSWEEFEKTIKPYLIDSELLENYLSAYSTEQKNRLAASASGINVKTLADRLNNTSAIEIQEEIDQWISRINSSI